MAEPRVIVVGAGPAGVRCAEQLVAAGLRPVLIDEGRRDGGQIYRRQPANFTRSYATLYGSEAPRAEALHRAFDALRDKIDYRSETLAWNVTAGVLHVAHEGVAARLGYDALVICSGATDRLMPVKGWEFAGTYSLGAAQIALKSQACSIGREVVFMGTGPVLYLVAMQYLKAGARIAAVLDTSRLRHQLAALPKLMARPALLRNGLAFIAALRKAGVPVLAGIEPLEILGTDRLKQQQQRMERFRQGLVRAFPWPAQQAAQLPDEAIVCRCETVTAGELRRVVCEMGAAEANRAKAFSRVGMGRCQGRYCGQAGAEVIAHAAGVPIELVGRLRGQAPVKPLPIASHEENQ